MKIGTDGVLLGCWAAKGMHPASIIDAGCGSGLLALMMAQRTSASKIIGVEIDPDAALDAADNAMASPWSDRIEIVTADLLSYFPPSLPHPLLIISNPPFFTETLRSPDASRSLARHGDTLGVESLIRWSAPLLTQPADRLCFIAPAEREREIEFQLELSRLCLTGKCRIVSREGRQPLRTIFEASPVAGQCENTTLTIRSRDNRYTPEYVALTSDFYLDKTYE